MRVAYDWGPLLDPPTGVGRYTRELAASLEIEGVELARFAFSLRGKGRTVDSVARLRVPARLVHKGWASVGEPSIERLTGRVDVVHGTNFVLPPARHAGGVVTIHDLSFLREDTFPGGGRLRALVPWSARRAAVVAVPTKAIADEVEDRLAVQRERIVVTPEGVAERFFGATPLSDVALERMGIVRPFAVAVGTLEPRKNLARFVKAWKGAADALEKWTLVLAGPRGWGPQLPVTRNVVPIGWVGDETLPGLLAASDLFCYPSLYEGFGLPPLEAMATGTACLAGRYSAAEEVLGDAALLVEPTDVGALTEGLKTMADPAARRRLELVGKARASTYTWRATAVATMEAYRRALA